MCGINGIWKHADSQAAEKAVLKMNDTLAHRGPDDAGVYIAEDVVLGHRRLAIIDLSTGGHQPMTTVDARYTITYNGELYNFKQLREQLGEYRFQTESDTEVILAAYAKWGVNCLEKFNGMFAFAIYDANEGQLFIARDRLGIKPLYFFQKEEMLIFSSELRALLACGMVPRMLDQTALVDYLRYQTVHAPNTIVQDVRMLLPGQYISASKKGITMERYWQTGVDANVNRSSYQEHCKNVNELLHKAVERRLVADVPFGAFLSGGIDSSGIVGLMSEVSSEKVRTFSVVFDDERYSEEMYAKMVADKFATEHHPIRLKASDFKDQLPNALSAMDHPSGDGPNTYVVSKVTKEAGITMVLSGLGGDELFAGYDVFSRTLALHSRKWIANVPMRKQLGAIYRSLRPSVASVKIAELLKQPSLEFRYSYPFSRQVLMDDQISALLDVPELPTSVVAQKAVEVDALEYLPLLSKVSKAEINTYMQNVLLRDTDQMSMAHALEVRVPFLDHELVEYILTVPDDIKNPVTPKKLLIDSLGGLLPKEVWDRKKMGFTLPWEDWMKTDLQQFCETQMNNLANRRYFNYEKTLSLWDAFLQGDQHITWARVWMLIVLEHWLNSNDIE